MNRSAKEHATTAVRDKVREYIDASPDLSDVELYELIERFMFDHAEDVYIPAAHKGDIVRRVYDSFRGLDVLQPLIDDRSISEIMVNRFDEVFIERDGTLMRTDVHFDNEEKLLDLIQLIVAKVNRSVNAASPIVDARLEDGSRVSVALPPVSLKGPTLTIRKFPEKPLTMDELIARGTLHEQAAQYLHQLVKSKYNIFIGGGTGSGKTTFLNALSNAIPLDERVITIEDSAELQLAGIENIVRMETRNMNTEGKGAVTIRDLIRASLRMRPNRIIVGEVRGPEALDMLQAMNTGHDGSLSTGHANSSLDMISRLETMVLSASPLPIEVIRKQICSAIDILIHLSRLRDKSRRVVEISEILGLKGGEIELNPLYIFEEKGEDADGKIIGQLAPTGRKLVRTYKLMQAGIDRKRVMNL